MRVVILTSVTILAVLWKFQKDSDDEPQESSFKRGVGSSGTIDIVGSIFMAHGFSLSSDVYQQFSTLNPTEIGEKIALELRDKGLESYWSSDQSLRVYSNEKLEFVFTFMNENPHHLTSNRYSFLILCKAEHKQPHSFGDRVTSIAISPFAAFSFVQAKHAARSLNEVYLWTESYLPTLNSSTLPYSSGQISTADGALRYSTHNNTIDLARMGAEQVENEQGTLIVLSETTLSHYEIDLKVQEISSASHIFISEWVQ